MTMRAGFLLPLALLIAVLLALLVGVRMIPPAAAWAALTSFDPYDADHVAFLDLRLPRLWAGLIAGTALGLAGVILRALTRNPLAEPGALGINAGAALAVVTGALIAGRGDGGIVVALAFPGALASMIAVFFIGGMGRGGAGPMRLALAGAVLNALLLSLTTGIVLLRSEGVEVLRFWTVGSLTQAAGRPLAAMAGLVALSALIALLIAPRLELLSLGDSMARGLGARAGRVKAAGLILVAMLAASSVAVAGPIAFLGLIVPELARRIVGAGLRAQMLAALLLGPAVLLLADVAGRLILQPGEVRAGLMVGLVGGPVFIALARRVRPGALA
ncbi:FecCD family ABC transporter permease [Gemmobacter serpentinus]|uniref:FecCD family ABC transporter permease n=1 Tax=Gemmobacter serpentinus TaxID=2652247 RepID=UPI00124C41E4|nr:iron ABC transporter permease [Gemmobacter serpentinus]